MRLFDHTGDKMFGLGVQLCPDPLESPPEGRERKEDWRRERGGLDQDSQDLWQIAATGDVVLIFGGRLFHANAAATENLRQLKLQKELYIKPSVDSRLEFLQLNGRVDWRDVDAI